MKRKWKRVLLRGEEYITCEELVTFLFDYLEGGLTVERAREFEKHLGICPPCVAYVKGYQQTIQVGRASLRDRAEAEEGTGSKPPGLAEELVRAILASRELS